MVRSLCRLLVVVLLADAAQIGQLTLPFRIRIDFGPAAALAQDELLAATPDANALDPYVTAKAAELGGDPATLFAFVRDQIAFESYSGSLRGARGTLWSHAGNALDQASLLIALLRAANVPARYVGGTLPDGLARELVGSMFPAPLRVIGCPAPGSPLADPLADPQLLAEVREHYWVQLDDGGGFRDADPAFAGAQIGDAFTAPQEVFAQVPDELRHKVILRLQRELTSPQGLFGAPSQDVATVLDETFNTVQLVGKPLSIGHFVNRSTVAAIFTSTTTTYSPYVALGDLLAPVAQDPLLRGTDYQETITNFPFGSQVLTGVFLDVDVRHPDGSTETFSRTLADLIGFAVRTNGGSPPVTFDSNGPTTLTDFDVFTVNVLPGGFDLSAAEPLAEEIETLRQALGEVDDDEPLTQQQISLLRELTIAQTRASGAAVFHYSDFFSTRFAEVALVRAYFDQPRIAITANRILPADGPSTRFDNRIDLRRNTMRTIVFPGQSVAAERMFRIARGIAENVVETEVAAFQASAVSGQAVVVSTQRVFTDALAAGIGLLPIAAENLGMLDALPISDEAKARIGDAVARAQVVVVPERPVTIGGAERIAWYQIDSVTGETVGVTEDGGHQGLVEYSATQLFNAIVNVGILIGFANYVVDLVNCLGSGKDPKECKEQMFDELKTGSLIGAIAGVFLKFGVWADLIGVGVGIGSAAGGAASLIGGSLVVDPPLPDSLLSPLPSGAFDGLAGVGVASDVVADPLFTLPFDGAQLPTVFRVGVKNTAAAEDVFAIDLTGVPAGFTAQASVPVITIPPGETAEVGICLRPDGSLPAPGTPASFTVQVTSISNPAVSTSSSEPFTVPAIHAVALESAPPAVSTTPGAPVETTLTVRAVGNVAEQVSLNVSLPAGLSASSLDPVALAAGESATRTLVLTPAPGTPLNSSLTATIVADFGAGEPQVVGVPVQVVVPGAQAAAGASVGAAQLGDAELANRLNDLGVALTNLVQDPGSVVFRSQALALLDSLIELVGDDPELAALAGDLAAARDALAAADGGAAILAAIGALGDALEQLAILLSDLARHAFDFFLSPNTAVAMPQTPVQIGLVLRNTGTETSTYAFAVENLPGDVTATFDPPAITLAPGEVVPRVGVPGVTLSLTPTSTSALQPVGFVVRATVQQADVERTAAGSLGVRGEVVSVVEVSTTPAFADAGSQVALEARVLNAVNQSRSALIAYLVKDPDGLVVASSTPEPVELALLSSVQTIALGTLDTTGFADGAHTIEVTLTETDGAPIPGATGSGSLLIGSPVTAFMALDPEILPPGDGQVVSSLHLDTDVSFPEPFTLLGLVDVGPIGSAAATVALHGTIAYVCGTESIAIVDVGDPTAPEVVGNLADGLINGAASTTCKVQDGMLYAATTFSGGTNLIVFSLADPLDPQQAAFLPFPYNFVGDFFVDGNNAHLSTNGVFFFLGVVNTIFRQFGDFLSIQITDDGFGVRDVVFDDTGPTLGGLSNFWQVARVTDDIAYVAGSSSQAGNTQLGNGRILVVDVSNPDDLVVLKDLPIPGTVHATGIAFQGNQALVASSTGGWRNPFTPDFSDLAFLGTTTLTSLDISNPADPLIVGESLTTDFGPVARSGDLYAAGGGVYAMNGVTVDGQQSVVLVDANDPANLILASAPIPADPSGGLLRPRGFAVVGNRFYAVTAVGLGVFEFSNLVGIPVTASVRVPKSSGVATVPGSFSSPPTEVIAGADFDTLVWKRAFAAGRTGEVITFASSVSDLAAGEARDVTDGATVEFVAAGTPGQIELPPLTVAAGNILGLTPASRTVAPGEGAAYTVSIANPAAQDVVYDLAVQGVPAWWLSLAASVPVAAGATVDVPLVLTSDTQASLGAYGFTVTAAAGNGAQGFVVGELVLDGAPAATDAPARGVVVGLDPASAMTGQGTPARFTVRVTNTGSAPDTFVLDLPSLPPGVAASLAVTLDVPPGAGGFRETTLLLTPQPGIAGGVVPFTVRATAQSDQVSMGSAVGELAILAQGVDVAIDPPVGPPATSFSLTVTNAGAEPDTFDLAVAGPLATSATLATQEVTLAPGAAQAVALTLGPLDSALPGNVELRGVATSRANPAATDTASALVTIAAVKGVDAMFEPPAIVLPAPGPASFLLNVQNFGNLEDAYSAAIVGTTGPVTAAMTGLTGQPTQTIDRFVLPGLANGAIELAATLNAAGTGTITVRIQPLLEAALFVEATAVVRTEGAATPTPTATPAPSPPPPTATPTPTAGPLDGFKCYHVRTKTGTPQLPQILGVELVDELETLVADVVREKTLCNPVAIDGAQPSDPATHRACYALRPVPGAKPVVPADATIANRFGEQTVRFLNSNDRTLCVPAEAHLAGTPASPAAGGDSFRCRRVRRIAGASLKPPPEVTLGDELESKRMRVRKIHALCTPVARDGATIADPASALACYQVAQLPGQPAFRPPGTIEASSELGAQTLIVRNGQRLLCVPTERR